MKGRWLNMGLQLKNLNNDEFVDFLKNQFSLAAYLDGLIVQKYSETEFVDEIFISSWICQLSK